MTPRLFLAIAGMQARKLMSYRADFWITTLATLAVAFGVVFFMWEAIFRDSGAATISGFSFKGMMLYYLTTLLITKFVWGGEGEGGAMADDIYSGGLSRYIVYPTSYFPFKYAERLGAMLPALAQMLVLGGVVFVVVDLPPEVNFTVAGMAMGLVSLLLANLLNFAILAPIEGVAFWADNVWSLTVIARFGVSILGGSMLPLALYPDWARETLWWLPFAHIYHAPANVILGKLGPAEWLASVGIALGWIAAISLLTRLVWRAGHRQYTGVGI
ncbi:MAG: ABC-2 family transporter protein [Candidatus Sumerlaeia bacterium]|nr:ABC-2 family transporter protein [Candidatus Sumerlaeia bacterium]